MSNNINLNALWVPVMPETSKLAPEMRKAGEQAKKEFVQGFTGGGGSGAESPEELGRKWGEQFSRSLQSTLDLPIPRGFEQFMNSLGAETKTTEKQMEALEKKVKTTFTAVESSVKKAIEAERELIRVTEQYNKTASVVNKSFADNIYGPKVKAAKDNYQAALVDVQSKQDEFISSTDKLSSAQSGSMKASNLMAGAVGALAGIFATLGIEAVIAGFKAMGQAISATAGFVMEAGAIFSEQSHQIQLYSTASGQALEQLERSAAKVYESIGSKGDRVGETIAVFSQRLGLTGEPLERLTRHVTELGERFGNFDARQLVDALTDFGVEGKNADAVLSMLVEKSRGASMSVSEMVTALGSTSDTMNAAGLSIEQGASLIAALERDGVKATAAINQLQTAQKEFTKQGWSFAEGMQMAGRRLQELIDAGDQAGADAFAKDVFGSRRWIDAQQVVIEYNAAIQQLPSTLDTTGSSVDDLIDRTEGLGNKWENLKHKAFGALSPLGGLVRDTLGSALDYAARYFEENSDEIAEKIRGIGHAFLDSIPMIQTFAAVTVEILGALGNMLIADFVAPIGQVAGFLEMGRSIMSGDLEGVKRGWNLVDKMEELRQTDFQAKGRAVGDTIRGWTYDLGDLHEKWDATVDGIKNNPLTMNLNVQQGVSGNAASSILGGAAGVGPITGTGQPYGLPAGTNTGGYGNPNAAKIFPKWVMDLGAAYNVQPSTYAGHQESGGVNHGIDWVGTPEAMDNFAKALAASRPSGLTQVIWQDPRTGERTGLTPGGEVVKQGGGYYRDDWAGHQNHVHTSFNASVAVGAGLVAPQGNSLIGSGADGSGAGTVSGNAAEQLLRSQLGAAGLAPLIGGGANGANGLVPQPRSGVSPATPTPAPIGPAPAPTSAPAPAPVGPATTPAPPATPYVPIGPVPQQDSLGAPNVPIPELPNIPGVPSFTPSQEVRDLVASGALPLDALTDPEKAKYPGVPGQYGGYGKYGAQDYASASRNQQAITDAQQRVADANQQIAEKQRRIGELEEAAQAARAEVDVWGKVDPKKIAAADQAVADAKNDVARAIRERGDAEGKVNDAVRKAAEDAAKPPDQNKTKRPKREAEKLTGLEAFSQLGGSLMGGLAQSLGLDMFGESPWDWGIFKLAASLGNWGMGTANSWADHIGAGKTGMTNFTAIPGWDDQGGLLNFVMGNGFGPNAVPTNASQVTASPNVSVNPSTSQHGQGMGQMPGPVSIDNSVNVTNNGPKQSDYDTWKQGQNSRTPSAMASLPR